MCIALQLGGDVEQPWLMSKYGVIHKTGGGLSHGHTVGNMHKKFGEDRVCTPEDMIADR